MKIYFLRHAKANWDNWTKPDDDRPLTKKGIKQITQVGAGLEALKVRPHLILSSPLPRAYQTAEIAAEALDMEVTIEPTLAPGFDMDKLNTLLTKYTDQDILLVGHEPSLSEAIHGLTGGKVELTTAGLARVDMEPDQTQHGTLVWLVTPKFFKS